MSTPGAGTGPRELSQLQLWFQRVITDAQGARYISSQPLDHSGKFMAENGRGSDHARVIATLPHFQIGSAGERNLDADQGLVGGQARNIDTLDAQIFAAVQHRRGHMTGRFG